MVYKNVKTNYKHSNKKHPQHLCNNTHQPACLNMTILVCTCLKCIKGIIFLICSSTESHDTSECKLAHLTQHVLMQLCVDDALQSMIQGNSRVYQECSVRQSRGIGTLLPLEQSHPAAKLEPSCHTIQLQFGCPDGGGEQDDNTQTNSHKKKTTWQDSLGKV